MDIKNGLVRGFFKVIGGLWAKQIDVETLKANVLEGAAINSIRSSISSLQSLTTQLNSHINIINGYDVNRGDVIFGTYVYYSVATTVIKITNSRIKDTHVAVASLQDVSECYIKKVEPRVGYITIYLSGAVTLTRINYICYQPFS